ncbi:DNA-binding CsgD family transcriptional regulator [Mycobacterium sp. MAA66]|uniref:ATP-binding protein n=1 Tax=Mycobacterium sp. MAA66 TaxID=3156297 RepID=UPI00351585A5
MQGSPLGCDRPVGAGVLIGAHPATAGCNVTRYVRKSFEAVVTIGLIGRNSEMRKLAALVDDVCAGTSRALVVRGEPGIGKSALLDELADQCDRCLQLRTGGVQAEMELPFAGLHQLLAPIMGHLDRLAPPQRDALTVAFGIKDGPTPDRFFIALAALNLLTVASETRPVLCLVDDEQWLDRATAQTLSFVARRLDADRVALVFAARTPSEELLGIPQLTVSGLAAADADALLSTALSGPIDPHVRAQLILEAAGNPLAILELPRGSTPAQLAGGFGLPEAAVAGRVEESFARRVAALGESSRRLIQLAAADPVGDTERVWRAATLLGIGENAALDASESGLVTFGSRTRFRHPLARSAAYRSASLSERRDVHRALAQVTDPICDPDRRAWHRAQACAMPDEDVAEELQQSAGRAYSRGGFAAAAAFLEHSAMLTSSAQRRAERMIAAARAKRDAASLDGALGLLVAAEAIPHSEYQEAEITHLRGQIAFDQLRAADAVVLLNSAATHFEPLDAPLAREARLDALVAAVWVGEHEGSDGLAKVAAAALAGPVAAKPNRAIDVLLDALSLRISDNYSAAAPMLSAAVARSCELERDGRDDRDWSWLMRARCNSLLAAEVWDFDSWREIARSQTDFARSAGALLYLQSALGNLGWAEIYSGDLRAAALRVSEDQAVAEASGNARLPFLSVVVTAWRGDDGDAARLIDTFIAAAAASNLGLVTDLCLYAKAVLYNGLGRHSEALESAQAAWAHGLFGMSTFLVPELAEAAARAGDVDTVRKTLNWIDERAQATSTGWLLGMQARLHALSVEDGEEFYRQSIGHLDRAGLQTETARAHLLYGEWLRRAGRRVDARAQLRVAESHLTAIGASGFAARARRELRASGETLRKRSTDAARSTLTSQEMQVALLARDGLSNAEIGVRLFISSRTAQYHLRKVFGKLRIRSRTELARVLDAHTGTSELDH